VTVADNEIRIVERKAGRAFSSPASAFLQK